MQGERRVGEKGIGMITCRDLMRGDGKTRDWEEIRGPESGRVERKEGRRGWLGNRQIRKAT
jgi:hypothetical protein